MEEGLKNRLIIILGILTLIFFLGTISSCSNLSRLRKSRDKEIVSRLDLEEKMSKILQEKSASDDKLNNATKALQEEGAAYEATKKALFQEQLVSQSLKEEMQKVVKLKEALEEDLKNALVRCKAADKSVRIKK